MAELLALIDLGSNATRFLVARVSPGKRFHVLRDERVQTRLAGGPSGRLAASAVERTVAATRRFVRSLAGRRPRVLAIGTAAMRDAANAGRLAARLRDIGGVCCLRPGVTGLSERIRAISVIDRYLEHARVFYFLNDGAPEYLLASADLMPRNLDRRVEIAFPVLEPALQAQIMETQLADTVKSRVLLPDGSSRRAPRTASGSLRSQDRLYELTAGLRS